MNKNSDKKRIELHIEMPIEALIEATDTILREASFKSPTFGRYFRSVRSILAMMQQVKDIADMRKAAGNKIN